MHFLTRVTLITLAAFTLLGTPTGECPEWLRLDLEVVHQLFTQVLVEKARAGELAEEETTLEDRVHGKAAVAVALADGRLTLPQAAARFRRWMWKVRPFWDAVAFSHPSGSTDEKLCHYLIEWTRIHLEDSNPQKARAVTRRLNAELEELLRTGSALVDP